MKIKTTLMAKRQNSKIHTYVKISKISKRNMAKICTFSQDSKITMFEVNYLLTVYSEIEGIHLQKHLPPSSDL